MLRLVDETIVTLGGNRSEEGFLKFREFERIKVQLNFSISITVLGFSPFSISFLSHILIRVYYSMVLEKILIIL